MFVLVVQGIYIASDDIASMPSPNSPQLNCIVKPGSPPEESFSFKIHQSQVVFKLNICLGIVPHRVSNGPGSHKLSLEADPPQSACGSS
jgi:hypothetical protein